MKQNIYMWQADDDHLPLTPTIEDLLKKGCTIELVIPTRYHRDILFSAIIIYH